MAQPRKIAILGASGYTGAELVRIIASHPDMQIVAMTADRKAGQTMGSVFPHLAYLDLPLLTKIEEVDFSDIDLAFCALPHGVSRRPGCGSMRERIADSSTSGRTSDPECVFLK